MPAAEDRFHRAVGVRGKTASVPPIPLGLQPRTASRERPAGPTLSHPRRRPAVLATATRRPLLVHSTSPAPAAPRARVAGGAEETAISSSYPIEQTPTSGCICNSRPTTDAHAIPAALPSPARGLCSPARVPARSRGCCINLGGCELHTTTRRGMATVGTIRGRLVEKRALCGDDRGRDRRCRRPPAQIPACASTHWAPPLGSGVEACGRARGEGCGVEVAIGRRGDTLAPR